MHPNDQADELHKLRTALKERDDYISRLRHDIQNVERSLTWKAVCAWQMLVNKALPKGGLLRRGYDKVILGTQRFFNDTLPPLLFRRMRTSVVKATRDVSWKKFSDAHPAVDILFINHEESRTGAPKILFAVAEHMKKSRSIAMVSLAKSTMHDDFADAFDPILYPADIYPHETEAVRAKTVLERIKPKIVYANSLTSFEYAYQSKKLGIKTIFHVHELNIAFDHCLSSVERKRFKECADTFIVPTEQVRNLLVNELGCDPVRVIGVPEFIDVASVREQAKEKSREEVRAELGLNDSQKLVLAMGSFNYRKGADIFIAAAKQLHEASSPARFFWMGNKVIKDPFVVDFEAHARYFTFLHEKVNPFPYLAAADVLVIPSREDPFPLVALEAMALGVPVAAFADAGGIPEAIGGAGRTVQPLGDITKLLEAINNLLLNEDKRASLGTVGKERALEYDAATHLGTIESLLSFPAN
jgi:glycosyltransferase involved in cell wall biosynthesis